MADYDFKSLSPIDFELLVRDLLQHELGVHFESFKPGRDKGIDFRHSPARGMDWIIQCKHYAVSGFSKLLSSLKNEELEKVKKLNPARYILATSVGLTPNEKDKLLEVFADVNLASGDILGREDLNDLLGKYVDVEQGHMKLWLSSSAVLERMLNSPTLNLTEDTIRRIQERAKLYVHNDSFPKALEMLRTGNICVICGIPGIGKTTLAEMLLLLFMQHQYQVVRVTEDIREAYALKHNDKSNPRLYYYDDFLGRTALGDKLRKNEDQRLSEFVQSVRASESAKLILTTREYILNQARREYERMADWVYENDTFVLDLSKYSRRIKAQILFNHVYFSQLPRHYIDALISHPDFLKLIDHKNYNPRLVEYMTNFEKVGHLAADEYFTAFRDSFDNPSKLWEHAFKDISFGAKNLVLVLFTLPTNVLLQDLKAAYEPFHASRCKTNNVALGDKDFYDALREADGNFTTSDNSASGLRVSFHNPSVADFVRDYLHDQLQVLGKLLETIVFVDQLELMWDYRIGKGGSPLFRAFIQANEFVLESVSRKLFESAERNRKPGEATFSLARRSPENVGRVLAAVIHVSCTNGLETLFHELLTEATERMDAGTASDSEVVLLAKTMGRSNLMNRSYGKEFRRKVKTHLLREYVRWTPCVGQGI